MASLSTSDKSVVQSRSLIVSKNRPYSDFDLAMYMHPNTMDIMPLEDLDAVKQAVKNLVLTNFNERPFNPRLGSNIRGFLFEPADVFTIVSLRNAIHRVITQYEPRVDSVTVQVVDNSDENRYDVTIGFRVITLSVDVTFDLYLTRLR